MPESRLRGLSEIREDQARLPNGLVVRLVAKTYKGALALQLRVRSVCRFSVVPRGSDRRRIETKRDPETHVELLGTGAGINYIPRSLLFCRGSAALRRLHSRSDYLAWPSQSFVVSCSIACLHIVVCLFVISMFVLLV